MTDGAVSNEEGLFRMVERDLGDVGLFTVGLGSAPNGWFMRKAAELGTARIFDRRSQSGRAGDAQAVRAGTARADRRTGGEGRRPRGRDLPPVVPDLARATVAFVARVRSADGAIGIGADGGWRQALAIEDARPAAGIAKLWARAKIEALGDARRRGADQTRSARRSSHWR